MPIPQNIRLTGNVCIKYIDEVEKPKLGDLLLLLNDDATNPIAGDYYNTMISGYIKAKVYDGLVWQNIDIKEFCQDREYQFGKQQYSMDTAELCREIMQGFANTPLKKTYRGHFIRSDLI